MNYGKNQLALLKFLHKWPDRWHRIKRRKAIEAAKGLSKKLAPYINVIRNTKTGHVHISLHMPKI